MLKNILSEHIDLIEIIFISLSVVSAFLCAYYLIFQRSVRAFIKLVKIEKINRRAKSERKKR